MRKQKTKHTHTKPKQNPLPAPLKKTHIFSIKKSQKDMDSTITGSVTAFCSLATVYGGKIY